MIDTILNLLFRCSHRHLSRPLTRVGGSGGGREGASYVVCLDCGKRFAYDLEEMRIGKPIEPAAHTHAYVESDKVEPEKPAAPAKTKLKYAVWAGLPLVAAIGAMFRSVKSPTKSRQQNADAGHDPAHADTHAG